jgi:hypothetical protein
MKDCLFLWVPKVVPKATKACKFLRFIWEKLETGEYFNYSHALSQQSGTCEDFEWESLRSEKVFYAIVGLSILSTRCIGLFIFENGTQ